MTGEGETEAEEQSPEPQPHQYATGFGADRPRRPVACLSGTDSPTDAPDLATLRPPREPMTEIPAVDQPEGTRAAGKVTWATTERSSFQCGAKEIGRRLSQCHGTKVFDWPRGTKHHTAIVDADLRRKANGRYEATRPCRRSFYSDGSSAGVLEHTRRHHAVQMRVVTAQ